MLVEELNAKPLVENYFNISSGQLLLGRIAVEKHLESGGHPSDLIELGAILRDGHPSLKDKSHPPVGLHEQPTKDDLISYGHWLIKVTNSPHRFRERTLNREILYRASQMGVGYTLSQICSPRTFDTLRSFYKTLGVEDTHRINNYRRKFSDWDVSHFVTYIKEVSFKIGRKPTREDFEKLAKMSKQNPSPNIIATRLGTLRRGLEFAGYPDIHSWTQADYIHWGVKVRQANEGRQIRTTGIEYLSFLKRGPSDLTIRKKFKTISNFQQQVDQAYIETMRVAQRNRQEKLTLADEGLKDGSLPAEIFQKVDDEDEKILRYARYIVLDEFFTDDFIVSKISIATMGTQTARKAGFIGSIRKLNGAITAGEVESVTLALDVFDDIWPMNDYMTALKVPVKNKSSWKSELEKAA